MDGFEPLHNEAVERRKSQGLEGPDTGFAPFIGIIALVALGVAISNAIRWISFAEVFGERVYLMLGSAAGCFTLGAVLFWFRDIRVRRWAMALQVCVGSIGGAVALFMAPDLPSKWAGFAAGIVAVADGCEKLWKAMRK